MSYGKRVASQRGLEPGLGIRGFRKLCDLQRFSEPSVWLSRDEDGKRGGEERRGMARWMSMYGDRDSDLDRYLGGEGMAMVM